MINKGHVSLRHGDVLEAWEYDGLEEMFQLVLDKVERGREEYGMDYLERDRESFLEQLDEELADIIGWPGMAYLKLHQKRLQQSSE